MNRTATIIGCNANLEDQGEAKNLENYTQKLDRIIRRPHTGLCL